MNIYNDNIINGTTMATIIDYIDLYGKISRIELSKHTGISPTGITNVCEKLIQAQIVRECGRGFSFGGRRPVFLEIDPRAGNMAVIQISKKRISISATNFHSQLMGCSHIYMEEYISAEKFISIKNEISIIISETVKQSGNQFAVIAISEENSQWLPYIYEETSKQVNVVTVCNSVNLFALAESRAFYNGEYSSLTYVSVGNTLELGQIENQQIKGFDISKSIPLGMCVHSLGEQINNTYNDVVGSDALIRYGLPYYVGLNTHAGSQLDIESFLQFARQNLPVFKPIFIKYGISLFQALNNAATILSPGIIVLGGLSEQIIPVLLQCSEGNELGRAISSFPCKLEVSHYAERGLLIGATKLALMIRLKTLYRI